MIEVENLSKQFGANRAVDNISFRVDKGEILGFLGPNGAGKTTTMRILTGYLPATSGTARIAGFDVFVFGFKSEFFNSASSLSVGEIVAHLANVMSAFELDEYPEIIFVCHSMGGLVVLEYLLDYPALQGKVPMLYLYSTPLEGSRLADLAQYILRNPGLLYLIQGRERNQNQFLDSLDQRWALAKEQQPQGYSHVYCAYETEKIAGRYVVDKASATRICEGTRTAITRNHIQMVKPLRADDEAITGLSASVKQIRISAKRESVYPKFEVLLDGASLHTLEATLSVLGEIVNSNDPKKLEYLSTFLRSRDISRFEAEVTKIVIKILGRHERVDLEDVEKQAWEILHDEENQMKLTEQQKTLYRIWSITRQNTEANRKAFRKLFGDSADPTSPR